MSKANKIYQIIEDDLGIYIHQINSDDNRHFMGEKIAIAIISKIIIEFLVGLIKPKDLGEKLRIKFDTLLNKSKEKSKDELEHKNSIEKFLSENPSIILNSENFSKSRKSISNYLISELELKEDKAESISLNICNSIVKNMSNENL